jgi:predicted RNA-binding protein with PIN domain
VKKLVYALESYAASSGREATVVFDGVRYRGEFAPSAYVRVLFSEPGETADALIGRLMREVPPRERIGWALVSDDRALRDEAVGMGLRRMGAEEFARELEERGKAGRKEAERRIEPPFNTPFRDLL